MCTINKLFTYVELITQHYRPVFIASVLHVQMNASTETPLRMLVGEWFPRSRFKQRLLRSLWSLHVQHGRSSVSMVSDRGVVFLLVVLTVQSVSRGE